MDFRTRGLSPVGLNWEHWVGNTADGAAFIKTFRCGKEQPGGGAECYVETPAKHLVPVLDEALKNAIKVVQPTGFLEVITC